MRIILYITLILSTLLLSGCGAFSIKSQPGFEPKMRYASEPLKVKVWKDDKGEHYLTDMEDNAIRRPWKAVGTFKALGPTMTSWWGAAREVGCDAFWIANEVQSTGNVTITTSFTGTVQGVPLEYGDQLCILFTDDEAEKERETEVNWIFTAYQRPPMNAGWNFGHNIYFDGGYSMTLEKYLRRIPLGLGVRAGTVMQDDVTWFSAGGTVLVPALNLWKLQLAPLAGAVFAFRSGEEGEPESSYASPFIFAGGYADLVLARFVAIGFGTEYWIPLKDMPHAPDGLKILFRYGFAF